MRIEPRIRLCNQLAIKPFLAASRFVAANQKDGLPVRIEGESHSPSAIRSVKPELLHICVSGAVKGIGARPAQLRAKLLKQPGVSQQFVLHALRQAFKFALKFFMEYDLPGHIASMYQKTYVVNSMYSSNRWVTLFIPFVEMQTAAGTAAG